jgi:hypothetical protein
MRGVRQACRRSDSATPGTLADRKHLNFGPVGGLRQSFALLKMPMLPPGPLAEVPAARTHVR